MHDRAVTVKQAAALGRFAGNQLLGNQGVSNLTADPSGG